MLSSIVLSTLPIRQTADKIMIDQIARQLFTDINEKVTSFTAAGEGSASQLRAVIESALRKMNIVTREEFDAQQAVLMRTREKLEALEARLAGLEQNQTSPKTSPEQNAE